jgi:hypothetical protein
VEHHELRRVGFAFIGDYADRIANSANNWAWMEYEVHTVLWALADTSPAQGACLTSQIFTFQAKLDALAALMNLRKVTASLIKRVNKFSSDVRPAQEARNRLVHDVWLNDNQQMANMGKLRVTASKQLDYKVESIPIAQLEADLAKIEGSRLVFTQIRRDILSALPTLPEMSLEELHPITDVR